jgi:alpha-mannosidase
MDEAWKVLLLNQFHDILPGSSIERVYDESREHHASVLKTAESVFLSAAAKCVSTSKETITVFNSLNRDRTELVKLLSSFAGAVDGQDTPLPCQKINGAMFAEVTVPSCGWVSVRNGKGLESVTKSGKSTVLENECLKVTFNSNAEITGILDKETNREMAAGLCNQFKLYKDIPAQYDGWDIDSMYKDSPVALAENARISLVSDGHLAKIIKVEKKIGDSILTQEIIIRKGSRRIDFKTFVDWRESHKLLKVNLPGAIYANEAIHEIQFGHLKRPNHASRPFALFWGFRDKGAAVGDC